MPPAALAMKTGAAGRAVDENAEIKLALDVEALFDQQAPDDAAFFAGLRRDQLHAEDLFGQGCGFIRRFRELHAAGFAAAAGVNLRFHDDNLGSQALRHRARVVRFENHFAARHGHAEFREDRLGLVFVNLHECSVGFLKRTLNSAKISASKKRLSLLGTIRASKPST